MQKLKVNDSVMVMTGKDKGKQGKVKKINFKTNRVLVDGINVFKKTIKPTQQRPEGGIVDLEKPVHISNVQVIDPKTQKPTRVKFNTSGKKKMRVSKTGTEI